MSRQAPWCRCVPALALCCYSLGCAASMAVVPASTRYVLMQNLPAASPGEFRVGAPWTFANLAVYPIHGRDQLAGERPVPLQQALDSRAAVVRETGDVGTLVVENRSDDPVWVQSGDIVKGGRQDRTIATDFLLPPRSGPVPVDAFCVESGRWSGRGGEPSGSFSSSNAYLASKELKLAARYAGDQSAVWEQVRRVQEGLSGAVDAPVASSASPSSLQLTLESPQVRRRMEPIVKALQDALAADDVVGFAFTVNGALNSAEVYASPAMFKLLRAKLLRAAAVEALAQSDGSPPQPATTAETITQVLRRAEMTPGTGRAVDGRLILVTYDDDRHVMIETPRAGEGRWIHRSYFTK
jgi:hypothetical protein